MGGPQGAAAPDRATKAAARSGERGNKHSAGFNWNELINVGRIRPKAVMRRSDSPRRNTLRYCALRVLQYVADPVREHLLRHRFLDYLGARLDRPMLQDRLGPVTRHEQHPHVGLTVLYFIRELAS